MIKIVLVFSLIFLLFACDDKKNEQKISSDLENKIANLQKELQKTTDPEAIDEIQKKLSEAVRQKYKEMYNKQSTLYEAIAKTTDLESCEKLAVQIEQLGKDMKQLYLSNNYLETSFLNLTLLGRCTENGYDPIKMMMTQKRVIIKT